ncbi:PrgI family protein [Streptomyces sp. ISL-22]|uniref:PrgI family protein n=1 Tax=unclassified Streptomyces TaxID=2593676 RepID=UPI001BEC95E6|nr:MULTISPECIES: PrgI family protein [unclassified Streptomyces]MBT2418081.1 PrgI family protein [Streptomyces sp. ISL-24]MBT2432244.1 PrgI family protein [Streptomyces sp. ISL-22]
MNPPEETAEAPYATRIPADISRPDRLLGPFTARQTAILTVAGLVLYGGWWVIRSFMTPLAYTAMVIPIAGAVAALALGQREGIGLDRFLAATLRHSRAPKRRVHAPEGMPPLPSVVPDRWARAAGPPPTAMTMPYDGVTADGVLDLGNDGKAALATCSTVNFELRSAAEQQGLAAAFARWLNSLTGPTQLLVRCHRIDLAPLADTLQQDAAALPHPALERAARTHADFLADLATGDNLLGRQIVLVAREESAPHGLRRNTGEGRALQRLDEAARALAAAEITVTPLDAERSAALVGAACNPDTPISPVAAPEGGPA